MAGFYLYFKEHAGFWSALNCSPQAAGKITLFFTFIF
jgi:hypothetical protein